MFNKGSELLQLCNEKDSKIYEIVLEKEHLSTGLSLEELESKMKETLEIMKSSATSALDKEIISVSGLTGGNSKR